MSFLLGSDGKLSVIRASLLAFAVGLLIVIGGLILTWFDQTSRQSPLDIEPYPGAIDWGILPRGQARQSLVFQIPDVEPEVVVAYYQQKINDFYGTTPEAEANKAASQRQPNISCERLPRDGDFSDYFANPSCTIEEGNCRARHQWTCVFDRSYSNMIQVTTVTIQPGEPNNDPALNTEGMTVVEHNQQWEP